LLRGPSKLTKKHWVLKKKDAFLHTSYRRTKGVEKVKGAGNKKSPGWAKPYGKKTKNLLRGKSWKSRKPVPEYTTERKKKRVTKDRLPPTTSTAPYSRSRKKKQTMAKKRDSIDAQESRPPVLKREKGFSGEEGKKKKRFAQGQISQAQGEGKNPNGVKKLGGK